MEKEGMFKAWLEHHKNNVYIGWNNQGTFLEYAEKMFKKDMARIALKYAKLVYKRHINVGSLEYLVRDLGFCIVVAVAGSNEKLDWFWNALLLSWKKIKLGAYLAANKLCKLLNIPTKPILVTGHSRAGASTPAFFFLHCLQDEDFIVYFNACPGVRGTKKIKNSIRYYNKFDAVNYAGELNFNHWECDTVIENDQHMGTMYLNHTLNQWDAFVDASPIAGKCADCIHNFPHCEAEPGLIDWDEDDVVTGCVCWEAKK